MKKLFLAPVLVVGLLAGSALPAGAWWWKPEPKQTIAEIVAESGGEFDRNPYDYDMLLNAAQAAGLVDALADPHADLTLFAPNDRAFIKLAQDFGYEGRDEAGAFDAIVGALTDLGGGDPIPVLTDVLLYHVAGESLNPFQVLFSRSIDTLQGESFHVRGIRLVDNEPDLRDPLLNIFDLDNKATNGVVHGIWRVLIPVDLP